MFLYVANGGCIYLAISHIVLHSRRWEFSEFLEAGREGIADIASFQEFIKGWRHAPKILRNLISSPQACHYVPEKACH